MDDYSMRPSVPRITTTATRIRTQTTLLDMIQAQHGRVARADIRLEPSASTRLDFGFEHRNDRFDAYNRSAATQCLTIRATGATSCVDFGSTAWSFYDLAWVRDGVWMEARHVAGDVLLTAGVRRDIQETRAGALFDFNGTIAQPGAGTTRRERVDNGFARMEWSVAPTLTLHGGLAATDRPADFMERVNYGGGALLDAERSRQVDAGFAWRGESAAADVSWFRAQHPNMILVSGGTVVVQEQVRREGLEARFEWVPAPRWTVRALAAAVSGQNESRDVPLAQTPPPEATLAIAYDTPSWGLSTALRAARRQTRVDVGYGNTLGVDLGPTAGFATLRLEGWWTPTKSLRIGAAVENAFDRFYQEHVSRTGSFAPAGFVSMTRVPEPGRALWVRVRVEL
jgi:iron complex outermembrane receptor protein